MKSRRKRPFFGIPFFLILFLNLLPQVLPEKIFLVTDEGMKKLFNVLLLDICEF